MSRARSREGNEPLTKYIIARTVGMIPALLLLLFMVVGAIQLLPGDAVDIMLAENVQATEADRARIEEQLGLGKPFPVQFAGYVSGVVQGDLGESLWSDRSVTEIIFSRLPVTLELAGMAVIIGSIAGIILGIISCVMQGSIVDLLVRATSIAGLSIPNFALGTLVIVLPTLYIGWTPPLTFTPFTTDPMGHFYGMVFPSLIIGISFSAIVMRYTRTMMLEVLRLDYIRTARAKGVGESSVVLRHALRNALIPVLSVIGLQMAALVSGTIIIEVVFALPGLGRLLLSSVDTRDYPVVQGIAIITGSLVMVVNLVVDLLYGVIDPRVKIGG